MMPTMGGCQPCATILGSVSQGIVTPRTPGQGGEAVSPMPVTPVPVAPAEVCGPKTLGEVGKILLLGWRRSTG